MELVVITSHVPEAIPRLLTPSLVAALQARGRTAHHLSALPAEDDRLEAGTFGVLGTPLDPMLRHRGPHPVTRCYYVLPADPMAFRSLPTVEARVRAARAEGSRFRVHHWILTEQESSGLVQRFEAACAPIRPAWVLSPWTDGRRWAQQVVDDLVGPRTSSPAVDPTPECSAGLSDGRATPGDFPPTQVSRVWLRAISDHLVGTVGLIVALVLLAVVAGVLFFVGLGGGN